MPLDIIVVGPFQDRPACELCSIIADNAGGPAIDPDKRLQFPYHPGT